MHSNKKYSVKGVLFYFVKIFYRNYSLLENSVLQSSEQDKVPLTDLLFYFLF